MNSSIFLSLPSLLTPKTLTTIYIIILIIFSPPFLTWSEENYPFYIDLTQISINNSPEKLIKERYFYSSKQIEKSKIGIYAISWAEKLLEENHQIPQTTYTLYREFQRTGDRKKFEKEYFLKRSMLTACTLLTYIKNNDSYLSLCYDLIWSICEETNWVLPAHERKDKYTYIDLFSSETATLLAHVLLFLDEKLPQEIKDRIKYEVKKRVMVPYLLYSEEKYGWVRGYNNWTGVCAGSIGETYLILEKNPDILKKALSLVIKQLLRFIQKGFAEDGGCLEGISYWNYGLTHFVSFSELLYEATDGKINLIACPKMLKIAKYPYVVYLGNGQFASFSDAPSQFLPHSLITHRIAERLMGSPHPFIVHRIAEKASQATNCQPTSETFLPDINLDYLHALSSPDPTHWLFGNVIRNILWSIKYEDKPIEPIPLKSTYLPISGIAKLVLSPSTNITYILACKAGSNNEPHNHNDIGSFIFCVNNTIFLTDPGAGLYSRDYFSAKRYENIFANSYGHSVPVIAGKLQSAGDKFVGKLIWKNEKTVKVDLTKAYDLPTLEHALRTFQISETGLTIKDSFKFNNQGETIQEALLTWLPVKTCDNKAIITSDTGTVEITSSTGKFSAESLKEHCIKNNKSGELTRITIDIPPQPHHEITIKIIYNDPSK